ncbi:cytochrome P450 [Nocardia callitridis]|uniref:Cytochrome P450 n=1 Tax=Nocardia callitridis TaxID=648753 RepID=A0ABP9KT27_9NOCA
MTETTTGARSGVTDEIPEYPMVRERGCPFAPPAEVRALGTRKPLSRIKIWDGSTPWLVTGYDELKTLMADPRVSVDDRRPGFPHWNEGMLSTVHKRPRSVFTSDGDEHTKYRRMMTRPFTFKRVEALRPAIQQITDDHIDTILAGPKPADLVTELALPVPSLVISELLGVPYEDHKFFQDHATIGVDRFATKKQATAGVVGLATYLKDLIEKRLSEPADDMVTELAGRVRAQEISLSEAGQIATGLLIAGHETTANMIALGTLALLENPEQLAIVRETEDPKVVAGAVEELLRYLSIIQNGQRRVATEDIDIGEVTIRGGEGIVIDLAPANWDPKAFAAPQDLDVRRQAVSHVGFGFGPHQCVGQQLARAELQIVFRTLLRRVPTLRLDIPFDDVEFKHDRLAFGVYTLPVSW